MTGWLFFRRMACVLCGMVLVLPLAMAQAGSGNAYTRIYVENRCYDILNTGVERDGASAALPTVPPRETALILFTWTSNVTQDETIRLFRKDAGEKRTTMQVFLDGARHERWEMGRSTVDSWFVTVCKGERPLDDPAGATFRMAAAGEKVAEYEMLFSRVPGSRDPIHVFFRHPVRLSLNGIPLRVQKTGSDGVLHVLFPEGMTGTVTLEAAPDVVYTLELGRDWMPTRIRLATAGEKVLIVPQPVGGPQDW